MKELRERDRPAANAIIAAALEALAARAAADPRRPARRPPAAGLRPAGSAGTAAANGMRRQTQARRRARPSGGRILFRNIGTLLSGDLAEPILSAASLLVEDGVISEIGTEPDADIVIDVHGATLAPGFWDSHFHPYFGDYSPRQQD